MFLIQSVCIAHAKQISFEKYLYIKPVTTIPPNIEVSFYKSHLFRRVYVNQFFIIISYRSVQLRHKSKKFSHYVTAKLFAAHLKVNSFCGLGMRVDNNFFCFSNRTTCNTN